MERRRRLVTRALPLTIVAVVAFAFGAGTGAPGSPEKEAAERFAEAWERKDFGRDVPRAERGVAARRSTKNDFVDRLPRSGARSRRCARSRPARRATPPRRDGDHGRPGADRRRDRRLRPGRGATSSCPTPTAASPGTRASSSPACGRASTSKAGSSWRRGRRSSPPTARPGRRRRPRRANTRWAAPRSTSPAKSAAADEEDLAALAARASRRTRRSAISGLEQAFNARLAGKPGGSLLAVADDGGSARILAEAEPRPGAPVKTTIDPDLQEAAVSALGRPLRRHRRARHPQRRRPRPRRPGLLGPPAPRVDLQDDHHHRRPAEGRRLARRRIRNHRRGQRRRPLHQQRQRRVLRRHLPRSLRRVLQRRLRPARAGDRQRRPGRRPPNASASTRRRPSTRRGSSRSRTRRNRRIPTEIGDELDLGVTAIGQGEVLATPLQMASVAQTIANGGVRKPTSIVANRSCGPRRSRCG